MAIRDLAPWRRGTAVRRGHEERGGRGYPRWLEEPFEAMERFFEAPWRFDPFRLAMEAWRRHDVEFTPNVDVIEDDEAITVTAELPGLSEQDIEVDLTGNTLTLKGEKKLERRETKAGTRYAECEYGVFYREIPLYREVIPEKTEAYFKNGVLTVKLPKTLEEQKRTRKIDVKAA